MAGHSKWANIKHKKAANDAKRGKIKLQTVSHSPVGYAVESGLLDEEFQIGESQSFVFSFHP